MTSLNFHKNKIISVALQERVQPVQTQSLVQQVQAVQSQVQAMQSQVRNDSFNIFPLPPFSPGDDIYSCQAIVQIS